MNKTTISNQALMQKVMLYLDNELNKDAERELLIEIKTNPQLMELFNKEKSFRDFIRSKINRRKVSPALVQNIKAKIQVASS